MRVGLWRKLSTEELMLWIVVLKKTLTSPLDCKEIQPVHPKGDQSWVFTGRTDAKAETPVLWPPHVKSWLIGKTLMLKGIGGRRRKGRQRMRGLDGLTDSMDEFEWTPGIGDGQGGLVCCDSWGRKESDMTGRLNWTELKKNIFLISLVFYPLPLSCQFSFEIFRIIRLLLGNTEGFKI